MNVGRMTYRQMIHVLTEISKFDPDLLDNDVTFEDIDGECYAGRLLFTGKESSLDEGHPVIGLIDVDSQQDNRMTENQINQYVEDILNG